LEVEIVKLSGDATNKVVGHHDKAIPHTPRLMTAYAADLKQSLGITIIPNSEIPIKSPDISYMNLYGFGMLKQRLFQRHLSKVGVVRKVLKVEWEETSPENIPKVFTEWKKDFD
jgi:hypothetical protein